MMKKYLRLGMALCAFLAVQTSYADSAPSASGFTPLVKPEPKEPKDPQDVEWEFQTITDGTQYYIYNTSSKQFLNDDNTLGNSGETLWTVSNNQIVSENNKYIYLWSTYVETGSGWSKKRTYTFNVTSSYADAATMSAIEAMPANAPTYYQIGNKVEYSFNAFTNSGSSQTRFVTATDGDVTMTTSNNNTANGHWLFISKNKYDDETGASTINKNDLIDAVNAMGDDYYTKMSNTGFGVGQYAPYVAAEYIAAFNLAMNIYNDVVDYDQDLIDETTETLKQYAWNANTEEVNAIAPAIASTAVSELTYGAEEAYSLPLSANTVYELTFNANGASTSTIMDSGNKTISLHNGSTGTVSHKFRTGNAGNYMLKVNGNGAEFSNFSLMTYDESAVFSVWTPQEVKVGKFILFNKSTGLFISADEADDNANNPTSLKDNHPTMFTATVNDNGKVVLESAAGKLGIMINTKSNSDKPTSIVSSANADDGEELTFNGEKNAYTISRTKSWTYNLFSSAKYTAYMSVETAGEAARLNATAYDSNYEAEWILVAIDEYFAKGPNARNEAMEILEAAIKKAEYVNNDALQVPGLAGTHFNLNIANAKDVLQKAESNPNISGSTIIETADKLEALTDNIQEISDYYISSLADIENIEKISSSPALRTLTTTARNSLQIATTKSYMMNAMNVLRIGVLGYMQTVNTFADGQEFTGLIGNHSFDTGTLDNWNGMTIDIDSDDILPLIGAIASGDLSAIFDKVNVKFNNSTKAVANIGDQTIENGHNKYYLTSNQGVMQLALGLPAGVYEMSGKMALDNSAINKGHLTTIVVSGDALGDIISQVLSDKSLDFGKLIPIVLEFGKITSADINGKGSKQFVDGKVRCTVNQGDILLMITDAGIAPLIGTAQYRADNIRLKLLRSANGIVKEANNMLTTAVGKKKEITANCTTGKAFTYDPDIVDQYNTAYDNAAMLIDNISFEDVMDGVNINNDQALANCVPNYLANEIEAINEAEELFNTSAFIAPTEDETFNIVMADGVAKCDGNAVTATPSDNGYTLAFSEEPTDGNALQVFTFEPASDTNNKVMRARMLIDGDLYYLSQNSSKALVLSNNPDDAVVFTVDVSLTNEGEITMSGQTTYLGTRFTDNTFVASANHINLNFVSANGTTGIAVIDADKVSAAKGIIYDLSGKRMPQSAKGIVIVDGKKVVK